MHDPLNIISNADSILFEKRYIIIYIYWSHLIISNTNSILFEIYL